MSIGPIEPLIPHGALGSHYLMKMRALLRRRYAELPQTAKAKLNPLLAETDCLNALEIVP